MAFQFLCPQGHLLQAEESQAGQQCQCPYCQGLFLIPPAPQGPGSVPPPVEPPPVAGPGFQPPPAPPEFQAPPAPPAPPGYQAPPPAPGFQAPPVYDPTAVGPGFEPSPEFFPEIQTRPALQPSVGVPPDAASFDLSGPGQQPIVHIICPSGHSLDTPREMLGQEAICPFCQVQFLLRYEDSVEHGERLARQQEFEEINKGKRWMQLAIAAAVLVVFGLIALMILSRRS